MSLQNLKTAFPNEVTPTHYEVRHPSNVGAVEVRRNQFEPDPIGEVTDSRHDDLLSALNRQKELEGEPAGPFVGTRPNLNRLPYVTAHYPDGSHFNLNDPNHSTVVSSVGPDGFFELDGNSHSAQSAGSGHRNLIHSLYSVGRYPPLQQAGGDVTALRDQALLNHDSTAALAAADAGDEAGMKPHQTEFVRSQFQQAEPESEAEAYCRYYADLSAALR